MFGKIFLCQTLPTSLLVILTLHNIPDTPWHSQHSMTLLTLRRSVMECWECHGVSESQEKMSGMSGVFVVLTSPTNITKSMTSLLTSSLRMSDIRSGCYAKGASLTNLRFVSQSRVSGSQESQTWLTLLTDLPNIPIFTSPLDERKHCWASLTNLKQTFGLLGLSVSQISAQQSFWQSRSVTRGLFQVC